MVCTYLIQATGTIYSLGFYIAIVSILGFIGTSKLKNFSSEHEGAVSDSNESGLILKTTENVKA